MDQQTKPPKPVKWSPALSVDTGHHPPQPWCWGISGEAKCELSERFGVRLMRGSEFEEKFKDFCCFLGFFVEPQHNYTKTLHEPKKLIEQLLFVFKLAVGIFGEIPVRLR